MRHQQRAIIERFASPTCRLFWSDMRRVGILRTLSDKGVLELEERWIGSKKIGIWVELTKLGQQLWECLREQVSWDDEEEND
jgi:hypothetical protein